MAWSHSLEKNSATLKGSKYPPMCASRLAATVRFISGTQDITRLASTIALVVPMNQMVDLIVETLAFTLVGLLLFAIAFWIIVKVSPFSIRKELEDDQNIALGIVIASVIIGIALIVSAAIHG